MNALTVNQSVHALALNQSVHALTLNQRVHALTLNQSVHALTQKQISSWPINPFKSNLRMYIVGAKKVVIIYKCKFKGQGVATL